MKLYKCWLSFVESFLWFYGWLFNLVDLSDFLINRGFFADIDENDVSNLWFFLVECLLFFGLFVLLFKFLYVFDRLFLLIFYVFVFEI